MTDSQRVYPRQALEAEVVYGTPTVYIIDPDDGGRYLAGGFDKETFEALFVPADVLDRLLAAVGRVEKSRPGATALADNECIPNVIDYLRALDDLRAAWRAYRQQVDG